MLLKLALKGPNKCCGDQRDLDNGEYGMRNKDRKIDSPCHSHPLETSAAVVSMIVKVADQKKRGGDHSAYHANLMGCDPFLLHE